MADEEGLGLDRRPDGVDDATVEAVGKLSEAFETVEDARGHLYAFHRLTGSAQAAVQDAADQLEAAGHREHAEDLRREVLGRNVVHGRWTFQLVEEYDDGYYAAMRAAEAEVRDALMGGRRHVFEAEMKRDLRRDDGPGQEAVPGE